MKKQRQKIYNEQIDLYGKDKKEAYQIAETRILKDFDSTCELGIMLMERFKARLPVKHTGYYMLTIRPDDKNVTFNTFRHVVKQYIYDKMVNYTYSFEQKGTSLEELGKGFHVHIIGTWQARDKPNILTQTINYFKQFAAANCIQLDICRNPEEVVRKYLTEYISEDEHKITTKEWDTKWREDLGLKHIYTNLSSPGRLVLSE